MTPDQPLRVVILGGVAWNTIVYVDTFPEPQPGTVFTRGYHETVGSSGAGKAMNMRPRCQGHLVGLAGRR